VKYSFKKAETEAELEQVFRLNHEVFAEEVRQHPSAPDRRLVDKFHRKNQYAIALLDGVVVGMIAFHDEPPYSVEQKLADTGVLVGFGKLAEIRLLAIKPAHRNGLLLRGLFLEVYRLSQDADALVISGLREEASIYRTLGFEALGPEVNSGEAWYIPMGVRRKDLAVRAQKWERAQQLVR
jgi:hypothetical protein